MIDIAEAKVYLENLLKERAQFQKDFGERVARPSRRSSSARRSTSKATTSSLKQLTRALLQQGTARNPDFLNTDGSKYDSCEKQGGGNAV